MKFICTLVVVDDVIRARKLYEEFLHQKVIADFGEYNVSFEGMALYKRSLYQDLIGDKTIIERANDHELYFEEDNLIELERKIIDHGFELLHGIREEPWRQRVFRFYDYDGNIVVIAETMEQTSYRLFQDNKTVEEISSMTGMPVEQVQQQIKQYEERKRSLTETQRERDGNGPFR